MANTGHGPGVALDFPARLILAKDVNSDISAGTAFQPRHLPVGQLETPARGMVHAWYMDLSILGNPLHMDADNAVAAAKLSPRQQRTLRRFYVFINRDSQKGSHAV